MAPLTRAPKLATTCSRSVFSKRLTLSGRAFSTKQKRMVSTSMISPSAGEEAEILAQQTTALVDEGRWRLCNNGKGLERQFKFKTFKATWDFMNAVAAECKKTKHHPEWSNVYNKTHIQWTTHDPEGLSSKDTTMARFCDQAGEAFGELPVDARETRTDTAGAGKLEVGDCCVPKKVDD